MVQRRNEGRRLASLPTPVTFRSLNGRCRWDSGPRRLEFSRVNRRPLPGEVNHDGNGKGWRQPDTPL
jgi:hypothetical protein